MKEDTIEALLSGKDQEIKRLQDAEEQQRQQIEEMNLLLEELK